MGNTDEFRVLRIRREQKEEEERLRAEQARIAAEQERQNQLRIENNKKTAFDLYDDMVMDVLQNLKDAAYPKGNVVRQTLEWILNTDAYSISVRVSVALNFDDNGNPTNFLCSLEPYENRAQLTRESLVEVLIRLHDPESREALRQIPPSNMSASRKNR